MASTTTSTSSAQSAPPASGGGGGCTPHLKRVLKSYQASAVSSLQGPPALMAAAALADEDEPLEAPAPPAIQQPPLLTPPDQAPGSERDETWLEWHSISCFSVGGERRLCLPQILNTVLMDFSLQQINGVCDELRIFCQRSNPEQLDVLKRAGVIPSSAPSCGLITKSDAERLCAALLPAGAPPPADASPAVVPVYHECFGGASGVVWLDAAKVRCAECGLLFSPRRFVCHAHHRSREGGTCHWGFDSARWRSYLLLDDREPLEDAMRALLQQFKDKFPDASSKRKQSLISPLGEGPCKKRAVRPAAPEADADGDFMAVGLDPALWYRQSQMARASAFKPWSPVVGPPPLRERTAAKALLPPQAPLLEQPVYLKGASLAYPVEAYIPADIAHMQKLGALKADPDRADLVPTLQHLKKAGGPAELVPKKEHMQTSCSRAAEAAAAAAGKLGNGRLSADTDETMSNSSLSTLSGVEDVSLATEEGASKELLPELRGLWLAFEQHSLGDRARQDIMREVNLLLAACQQRQLLANYKLLFHHRQEAEPMSCKLGSMPKGSDLSPPHLPLGVASPPRGAEEPPAEASPVNLSEGKEERSPPSQQRATPVEPHPMLLAA